MLYFYQKLLFEFLRKNIDEKSEKSLKTPKLCVISDICDGLGIKLYDFFDNKEFNNLIIE